MSSNKPLWHGILLVAGGAIGAGMFSLPFVAAGAWMIWASVALVVVWLVTYCSSSLLARVNIAMVNDPSNKLTHHCSFNTLVTHSLGKYWALANNISFAFIMIILMYAYTTAGASILSYTVTAINADFHNIDRGWLSITFALFIALVVWLGTAMVSRFSLLFMALMALLFVAVIYSLLPQVKPNSLLEHAYTLPFIFAALPVFVTAFACAGLVPTLVRHYEKKPERVYKSLFVGTFIALAVYFVWLWVTLGSIERFEFVALNEKGGDIGSLVSAIAEGNSAKSAESRLTLLSHFAILTSFLSVSLGFMHFIQDKFNLSSSRKHGLVATLLCFSLPTAGSFWFPYGFVHAIGFAGLFVAFSFFILPSVMAFKTTHAKQPLIKLYLPSAVMLFGIVILGLKIGLIFDVLPQL